MNNKEIKQLMELFVKFQNTYHINEEKNQQQLSKTNQLIAEIYYSLPFETK